MLPPSFSRVRATEKYACFQISLRPYFLILPAHKEMLLSTVVYSEYSCKREIFFSRCDNKRVQIDDQSDDIVWFTSAGIIQERRGINFAKRVKRSRFCANGLEKQRALPRHTIHFTNWPATIDPLVN